MNMQTATILLFIIIKPMTQPQIMAQQIQSGTIITAKRNGIKYILGKREKQIDQDNTTNDTFIASTPTCTPPSSLLIEEINDDNHDNDNENDDISNENDDGHEMNQHDSN